MIYDAAASRRFLSALVETPPPPREPTELVLVAGVPRLAATRTLKPNMNVYDDLLFSTPVCTFRGPDREPVPSAVWSLVYCLAVEELAAVQSGHPPPCDWRSLRPDGGEFGSLDALRVGIDSTEWCAFLMVYKHTSAPFELLEQLYRHVKPHFYVHQVNTLSTTVRRFACLPHEGMLPVPLLADKNDKHGPNVRFVTVLGAKGPEQFYLESMCSIARGEVLTFRP